MEKHQHLVVSPYLERNYSKKLSNILPKQALIWAYSNTKLFDVVKIATNDPAICFIFVSTQVVIVFQQNQNKT